MPNDPLLEHLRSLTDANPETRKKAFVALNSAFLSELIDTRECQALAAHLMLHDPNEGVRLHAFELVESQADMGMDVGFAVPALVVLAAPTEPREMRLRALGALRDAAHRTEGLAARCPAWVGTEARDAELEASVAAVWP